MSITDETKGDVNPLNYKRVYKIDVGNIDEDDLEEYIKKVKEKFAAKINPDVKSNFNILDFDEDIFLPVKK